MILQNEVQALLVAHYGLLIVEDRRLVVLDGLLVRENRGLVLENQLLVGQYILFCHILLSYPFMQGLLPAAHSLLWFMSIMSLEQIFAQYSKGTVVEDMIDRFHNTRITDIKHRDGLEIRVRPIEGLRSTVMRKTDSLLRQNSARADPARDCMATIAGQPSTYTKIGQETIRDVSAIHAVEGKAEGGERHIWFAPNFGCYVIQQRWRFKMADGSCTRGVPFLFLSQNQIPQRFPAPGTSGWAAKRLADYTLIFSPPLARDSFMARATLTLAEELRGAQTSGWQPLFTQSTKYWISAA